ncbi:transmembrane protein 61, partial [Notamacropus eugenii]|uniref:transmembrane protein 61 n=1 Tax=Notamacropus eugenii TaxID=9315 RepID=UPI003B681501
EADSARPRPLPLPRPTPLSGSSCRLRTVRRRDRRVDRLCLRARGTQEATHPRSWTDRLRSRLRETCDRRVASSFRYGVTITGAVVLVTGTLCFAWWSDGDMGPSLSPGTKASLPGKAAPLTGTPAPTTAPPSALLRSVSFFCCGIGGMLLLWGLLWSAKANVQAAPRYHPSRLPRDPSYFTAEPSQKWSYRRRLRMCASLRIQSESEICTNESRDHVFMPIAPPSIGSWSSTSIPTYEMAVTCSPPVPEEEEEENEPPPYSRANGMRPVGLTRSISDGALLVPLQPEMWGNQGTAWVSPPPSYESIDACGL